MISARFLCSIILLLYTVNGTLNNTKDAFERLMKGLYEYRETGIRPGYLENAMKNYKLPKLFPDEPDSDTLKINQVCLLCDVAADLVLGLRRGGMTKANLLGELIFFCTSLGIEAEEVCAGTIEPNLDVIAYIIDNKPSLNGIRVCALILQTSANCYQAGNYEWSIDVPSGNSVKRQKATGVSTFNILHVTDFHYESHFEQGKVKDCGKPYCCLNTEVNAPTKEEGCGYWGEYVASDVPWYLVQEVVRKSKEHIFDYVYMTGDVVSHRVWDTSIEGNTETLTKVYNLLAENYKVPVFPVLGNHEPHPLNVFAPNSVTDNSLSTAWLFKLLKTEWPALFPDGDAEATVLKGGYYTASPKKGFRVVVLNSNVCSSLNWWLLYEDYDPYGQLEWLVKVLVKAEEDKEIVHILSHVPTGHADCLHSWSREYNRIIERFAYTVAAQFYGHSHKDEFYLHYNKSNSLQAINVGFNGASIVMDRSNPSYKLYKVDSEVYEVLDFDEWTFNLTQANAQPEYDPFWYKLYSFKQAFNVDSLLPSDLDTLVLNMAKDHSMLDEYNRYKFRNADVTGECDNDCKKRLLCSIATTDSTDKTKCEQLSGIYDANV